MSETTTRQVRAPKARITIEIPPSDSTVTLHQLETFVGQDDDSPGGWVPVDDGTLLEPGIHTFQLGDLDALKVWVVESE